MLRPLALACALVSHAALAATSIQLAEGSHAEIWPMDFAVSATHWYVAYARFPSADAVESPAVENLVIGIYARESGAHVATLALAHLWADGPKFGSPLFVSAAAYRDGFVVAALSALDGSTFLAYVGRNGEVRQRRRAEGLRIGRLRTHRDLVLATASQQVALFDKHLSLRHDWSTADTVVLAESTEGEVVVLEGVGMPLEETLSGTVRWLVLEDRLRERMAVPVPFRFVFHPRPKLLTWPDGISLVLHDGEDWRECRLPLSAGAFECGVPAWGADVNAIHEALRHSALNVVRSGDDGYVVTSPNGCAIWSRRHDRRSHALAPRQLAFPAGSSDLGLLRHLLVREWGGTVFVMTSAFLTTGWDGGENQTVLREAALRTSPPVSPAPRIPGCPSWNDFEFSREVTAGEVGACVRRGADPNAVFNCGEWTRPLGMAARQGNATAVRVLIGAGAEVNAADEEGDTALHDAARHASSEATIQALVEGGADATLRNRNGKLAWDYARVNEALRESALVRELLGVEQPESMGDG